MTSILVTGTQHAGKKEHLDPGADFEKNPGETMRYSLRYHYLTSSKSQEAGYGEQVEIWTSLEFKGGLMRWRDEVVKSAQGYSQAKIPLFFSHYVLDHI